MEVYPQWVDGLKLNHELVNQWAKECPKGVPLLYWCLKTQKFSADSYISWAKEFYKIPAAKPDFFNRVIPVDLFLKFPSLVEMKILPLQEWNGTLYLGCLEPQEIPFSMPLQWILLPLIAYDRWLPETPSTARISEPSQSLEIAPTHDALPMTTPPPPIGIPSLEIPTSPQPEENTSPAFEAITPPPLDSIKIEPQQGKVDLELSLSEVPPLQAQVPDANSETTPSNSEFAGTLDLGSLPESVQPPSLEIKPITLQADDEKPTSQTPPLPPTLPGPLLEAPTDSFSLSLDTSPKDEQVVSTDFSFTISPQNVDATRSDIKFELEPLAPIKPSAPLDVPASLPSLPSEPSSLELEIPPALAAEAPAIIPAAPEEIQYSEPPSIPLPVAIETPQTPEKRDYAYDRSLPTNEATFSSIGEPFSQAVLDNALTEPPPTEAPSSNKEEPAQKNSEENAVSSSDIANGEELQFSLNSLPKIPIPEPSPEISESPAETVEAESEGISATSEESQTQTVTDVGLPPEVKTEAKSSESLLNKSDDAVELPNLDGFSIEAEGAPALSAKEEPSPAVPPQALHTPLPISSDGVPAMPSISLDPPLTQASEATPLEEVGFSLEGLGQIEPESEVITPLEIQETDGDIPAIPLAISEDSGEILMPVAIEEASPTPISLDEIPQLPELPGEEALTPLIALDEGAPTPANTEAPAAPPLTLHKSPPPTPTNSSTEENGAAALMLEEDIALTPAAPSVIEAPPSAPKSIEELKDIVREQEKVDHLQLQKMKENNGYVPLIPDRCIEHIQMVKKLDLLPYYTLHKLRKHFDKTMILRFENDILKPWKWDDQWKQDSQRPITIDLTEPSIFRIVKDTKFPYHGYIIPNTVNEEFFTTWNEGSFPGHVTVYPLKADGEVIGMLLAITSIKKGNLIQLDQIEEVGEETAHKLAQFLASKAA